MREQIRIIIELCKKIRDVWEQVSNVFFDVIEKIRALLIEDIIFIYFTSK